MFEIHMIFQGFEWDAGNKEKNLKKHGIVCKEAEECFFNFNIVFEDNVHSIPQERRFVMLGETNAERRLFIAFTIRKDMARVISARPMHKKERAFYEEEKKNAL